MVMVRLIMPFIHWRSSHSAVLSLSAWRAASAFTSLHLLSVPLFSPSSFDPSFLVQAVFTPLLCEWSTFHGWGTSCTHDFCMSWWHLGQLAPFFQFIFALWFWFRFSWGLWLVRTERTYFWSSFSAFHSPDLSNILYLFLARVIRRSSDKLFIFWVM